MQIIILLVLIGFAIYGVLKASEEWQKRSERKERQRLVEYAKSLPQDKKHLYLGLLIEEARKASTPDQQSSTTSGKP